MTWYPSLLAFIYSWYDLANPTLGKENKAMHAIIFPTLIIKDLKANGTYYCYLNNSTLLESSQHTHTITQSISFLPPPEKHYCCGMCTRGRARSQIAGPCYMSEQDSWNTLRRSRAMETEETTICVYTNVHRIWRQLSRNVSLHDLITYDSIQRWNQDAPTEKFKVQTPEEYNCCKTWDSGLTGRIFTNFSSYA